MDPKFRPRFSLLLLCLICLVVSLVVAWAGILQQLNPRYKNWEGFPVGSPRQEGFVEAGRLSYEVIDDLHGGNGLHARLHIRIKLNHDRVFLHSIENCVKDMRYVCYSLHDRLVADDPAQFVEDHVKHHLQNFNGTSCVASVELIDYELEPKTPSLATHGIQPIPASGVQEQAEL